MKSKKNTSHYIPHLFHHHPLHKLLKLKQKKNMINVGLKTRKNDKKIKKKINFINAEPMRCFFNKKEIRIANVQNKKTLSRDPE